MQNHKIILHLESTTSRIEKEKIILNQMENKNKIFLDGLKLAYDKLLTFGVKKIPISSSDGCGIQWEEFLEVAKDLISRKLTGHAARDKVLLLMEKSEKNEWNHFYKRILQKDMRCGLSEKTINNVAKKNNLLEYIIPVFACQLAQDSDSHKKKLIGEKILEVKLDGVRVISILYPNAKVDFFSRNGKELLNFEHLQKELSNCILNNPIEKPFVLDGEIVSKNFQELMKQIHRKNSIQNNDATLYLFDIIPFESFKEGIEKEFYNKRSELLNKWYSENVQNKEKIKLIDKTLVNLDTNEGKSSYKEFNKKAILHGYEGIMIKDPDSFYECKRSTTWLKLKPVIEISLEVKEVEEGSGKNIGKLGAVIAEGEDNGKFFRLNIGSGFTDKQRKQFWENKKQLIGQIIEIRADSISKSQNGDFWSLRFPRFKCFRGFEKMEKL
ncbi:MAG: ATP-dependent DNA ligase [Alphaproteobacteria bacterium]